MSWGFSTLEKEEGSAQEQSFEPPPQEGPEVTRASSRKQWGRGPPEQHQNIAQLTKQPRGPSCCHRRRHVCDLKGGLPALQLLWESRHETESLCQKGGKRRWPRTLPPHSLSGSADFTCRGFACREESQRLCSGRGEARPESKRLRIGRFG